MKFKVLAVAALIFSQLAWGVESNGTPDKPQISDSASWGFRLSPFAFIFEGIEKALQESGVEFEACSYVSYQTQTTTSAKGMAECLHKNFFEGIFNKGDVGITYVWVKSLRQETLPIRIDWRPAQEGLLSIGRELLTLWNEKVSKDPTEEKALSYSQNIFGMSRITFPAGTSLADFIPAESGLLNKVEMAKQLDFSFTPVNKVGGYANYHGVLTVTPQTQSEDDNGQWSVDFKTNFNLLKSSRKFKVKGNIGHPYEEGE